MAQVILFEVFGIVCLALNSISRSYYFLIIIFYSNNIIRCQYFKPDITLLSRITNENKYICVIGNNLSDHAVTFVTPLSLSYLAIATAYRNPEGISVSDEFNCDFENECSKIYDNNNWETVKSENHILPIINDIRFEKLYTQRTSSHKNQIAFAISERDFFYPISLRAEGEPQILLCTDGKENEDIFQCYWLRIEKNDDFEIAIRNCSKVNKNIFSIKDSGCVLLDLVKHDTNLVRNLDWFHFIILRTENKLFFRDALNKNDYIILEDLKYNLKTLYVRTSDGNRGEWKIHKNSYLKLKSFDLEVQLGPAITSNNDIKFCISILVSICQGCTLEIQINNQQKQKFSSDSDIWRNIKLVADNIQQNEFKIFIKGTRLKNTDIIAIDNIRLCHENEIRILSIKNKFEIPSISCKVLQYPTWYTTLDYTSKSSSDVCSNAKYIGKNCDIPCSTVLGQDSETEFCNKHFICRPHQNFNENECICASGYRGLKCDEPCSQNYFSYNCQKRCGHCKNNETCLKSSGVCLQGCEFGYAPETCTYKSYEPINLACASDAKGQVNLNWQHPKSNESVTKYGIMTSLIKSETSKDFFKMEENHNFPHRMDEYSYLLKKTVPLSSTYSVEVCGNNDMNHCSKNTFVTLPVQPVLKENFIIVEYNDDHSKIVKIPGILPDKKSKLSYMYVTICNESSNFVRGNTFSNDSIILSYITCSGVSWIAAKIETHESGVTFIVGDGKKSPNVYNNPPLEGYNNYNICVVVTNVYENQSAFNVYCELIDYDPYTNFIVGVSILGVLTLGIVIFIIVCTVKSLKQPKHNRDWRSHQQNITELNPLQSETSRTQEPSQPQPHCTDL